MESPIFRGVENVPSVQPLNSSSSIPWSPGQLTASVLQDPLALEFQWPEANQTQWTDDILKNQDWGNVFMGSEQPGDRDTVEQPSDRDTVEQLKRELAQVKQELESLRQELDSVRSWMDEVVTWSENINKMLASQGSDQQSSRSWTGCIDPGCICQWEEEVGLMEEPSGCD